MNMKLTAHLSQMLSEGITGNQIELVELLNQRGIKTTQSTVSRALKKIRAVKGTDKTGNIIYFLPKAKERVKTSGFIGSLVNSVVYNQSVIIVHTIPGTAMTVAKFIDDRGLEKVLGSIAGDDTIMIIPADINKTQQLSSDVEDFFREIGIFF